MFAQHHFEVIAPMNWNTAARTEDLNIPGPPRKSGTGLTVLKHLKNGD